MNILISQIDAREVRSLFKGFDDDEFNNYVLELQEFYLMPLLGVALYEDLIAVTPSRSYVNLLAGEIYSDGSQKVSMKGIKRYLSYLFFYKFSMEGSVKYTQSGRQNFDADYAERSPKGLDANVIQSHLDKAQSIGEEIQKYLEDNSSSYPLYEYESKLPNKDFSFKVIGDGFIPFRTI